MIDRLTELYRFPIIRFFAVGGANFILVCSVSGCITVYRLPNVLLDIFAVGLFS